MCHMDLFFSFLCYIFIKNEGDELYQWSPNKKKFNGIRPMEVELLTAVPIFMRLRMFNY